MADQLSAGAATLRSLRGQRRRNRVRNLDWFEAAYRAYITGIVAVVVVLVLTSWLGDNKPSAAGFADLLEHGPAAIGVVAAAALALGMRSGSRGGPLAVESAENGVVNPGLLHEFKLPLDIAVEAKKQQPAIDAVRNARIRRSMTVRSTTAQDAMAIGRLQSLDAVRADRVARIGTPHVGTYGTLETVRVAIAIAKLVRQAQVRIVCIGRQHQRRAILPTSHTLGGEAIAGYAV